MTEAPTQTRHGGCKVRAHKRVTRSQAAVGRPCVGRTHPTCGRLGEHGLLRIEAGLLSERLRSAPAAFARYALNSARNIQIGGCKFEEIQNFLNFMKLVRSRPCLHRSGEVIGEPVDANVSKGHLEIVCSQIRYPKRPFMRTVTAEKRSKHSTDIARILFGGVFADQTCMILGSVKVNSPLIRGGTMTKRLRTDPRRRGIVRKKLGMSDAWY